MKRLIFKQFKQAFTFIVLALILMNTSCTKDEPIETTSCKLTHVENIRLTELNATSVTLLFDDNAAANSYSLELSTGASTKKSIVANSQNAKFEDLTPETEYTVTIRSICTDGSISANQAFITFKTKKSCILSPVNNLTVELDTNTNIIVAKWDAHANTSNYYATIHDSRTNKVVFSFYNLNENRLSTILYTGMSVYVKVHPICKDNDSVSDKSASSTIFTTLSLMPEMIPADVQTCIISDCSIIDALSPILIHNGNSGGEYPISFTTLPLNGCRTFYFRFTWNGGYADLPVFISKKLGKIQIYIQSPGCATFSNKLEKVNGDIFRQIVKINGQERFFGIACYKSEVRIFVNHGIEMRGKSY